MFSLSLAFFALPECMLFALALLAELLFALALLPKLRQFSFAHMPRFHVLDLLPAPHSFAELGLRPSSRKSLFRCYLIRSFTSDPSRYHADGRISRFHADRAFRLVDLHSLARANYEVPEGSQPMSP